MYRMIKAVGYDGTDKLNDISAQHSLIGTFYWGLTVGSPIGFVYNDDSGKMMRSSTIQEIVYCNNQIRIKTRNTEYWFEKVEGQDALF